MLAARAYSLRQKSRLAISLSWIAGYTNVATLIVCGMMSSHVTGNVTHLSQKLSEYVDPWGSREPSFVSVAFLGWVVLTFLAGAVLSGWMSESSRRAHVRSQFIPPLVVQAVLLSVFTVGVVLYHGAPMSTTTLWLMTAVASCAMGLQNATITKISGAVVRTTHLTGVVTDLGLELVTFGYWLRDKLRHGGPRRLRRVAFATLRHPSAHRLALLATIFGSFVFGVVAGTLAIDHAPRLGLIPPVLFLLFIIAIDYFEPIADVKELDAVSDPELRSHGIEKSMLPKNLAIYRVAPRQAGQAHAAPQFGTWLDDVPKRSRVVILSLSRHTELDANAVLDLAEVARNLASHHRRLILANVTPAQFEQMQTHGLTDSLGTEDVCPDLEFAVARAVEVAREMDEAHVPVRPASAVRSG
jgi:uncharacterized membrane protein YoaK (UPF0700 family)